MNQHEPLVRLRGPATHTEAVSPAAAAARFQPVIKNSPSLPAIDFSLVGQSAPKLLNAPSGTLPKADAVVITWASAEWAALQHVFCDGGNAMPYSDRNASSWPGWQKYEKNLPSGHPSDWTFWGEYRLAEIGPQKVLLFKSNTHLDWPGQSYLESLIQLLIKAVQPKLIFSIGTAGGAKTEDHIGTVHIVSSGALYQPGQQPSQWPVYKNPWQAPWTIPQKSGFAKLLFPVPTTNSDLASLGDQFNSFYKTSYSLSQLDPNHLCMGNAQPEVDNQSGGSVALLTTPTFLVGTTDGAFQSYACLEMDDAVIGEVCGKAKTSFGFVRNLSDPVQNAALPASVQGNWGSAIYTAYGLYTSYNGALAAWAILAG
jgi:hypothetical protein